MALYGLLIMAFILAFVIITLCYEAAAGVCSDATLTHGYKCEEHHVVTDDGYILSLDRFPEGRAGGSGMNKQPVYLQHGLFVDGATWLMNSADGSLALILADNNYDVWIGNTRGTKYSRRHVSLDPNRREFWDWTWDELVLRDLKASVNFVFNQTGQKVHYVGHSLGTLTALASFSEGKLVDKVKSAALLCPIAYLSHMTTTLGNVAAKGFLGEITASFGVAEFNPKGKLAASFLEYLCATPGVNCFALTADLTGNNCCLNASTIDVFLKNEPQSTSAKNLVHLAQIVRDGIVAKYDYGNVVSNLLHYGAAKPPVYNLANIPPDFPLFLSYGGQDALSDAQDVENLLDTIKFHDTNKLNVQFLQDFAHVDFIIGFTAKDIVYNQIMAFFERYE